VKVDNFFAELKRRNVYKVAVAYAVVGWLLVQVATQVFPFLEIPNWVIRLVIAVIAIGFPIALVIAWAFELTPEGLKRTETADAAQQRSKSRAWIYIVVMGAAVSLGLFFLGRYTMSRSNNSADGHSATAATSIPDKSIAVLPFENLSDEKQNAYFAAGIQDEILTRLAKIGALKVISRSSTQQYQSKPGNLRAIAQELGVANILEGSVQKAGTAVHVNVQLIKAATDDHLWAESYDRTLENIFGVEGEIAQAVAEALRAKLSGAEEKLLAQKPTTNPAAYDAYLRGMAKYSEASGESWKAAMLSLEEAVRLDPQFAAAWAALSRAHSRTFFSSSEMTQSHRAAAEKALNEAMRLQPGLPETQLARAYFQYWVVRDYRGALEMMQQLRVSWPNNSDVLEAMALISARLGDWPNALSYGEQGVALNPKELLPRIQLIQFSLAMRDLTRALAMIDNALQVWPNDPNLIGQKVFALQARGQLDEAQAILGNISLSRTELDVAGAAMFYQAWVRRDPSMALEPYTGYAHGPGAKDPSFLIYYALLQRLDAKTTEADANFMQARDILQSQLKEQPNNDAIIGPLVFALAALGQREDALRFLEQYDKIAAGDARSTGTGYELRARVLVRLGDKDGAIASLEKLLAVPSDPIFGPPVTPALLRLDPDFDPLRGDPRFEKLAADKP
jgi:TolB-like protein